MCNRSKLKELPFFFVLSVDIDDKLWCKNEERNSLTLTADYTARKTWQWSNSIIKQEPPLLLLHCSRSEQWIRHSCCWLQVHTFKKQNFRVDCMAFEGDGGHSKWNPPRIRTWAAIEAWGFFPDAVKLLLLLVFGAAAAAAIEACRFFLEAVKLILLLVFRAPASLFCFYAYHSRSDDPWAELSKEELSVIQRLEDSSWTWWSFNFGF